MNFDNFEIKPEPERPPIYITSPENNHANMSFILNQLSTQQGVQMPQRPSTPLTVNTNIASQSSSQNSPHGQSPNRILNIQLPGSPFLGNSILSSTVPPLSPNSFTSFNQAVNTPLPPSPSPGSPMAHLSDDDMDGTSSLYCTSPGGSHAGSEYGEEMFK